MMISIKTLDRVIKLLLVDFVVLLFAAMGLTKLLKIEYLLSIPSVLMVFSFFLLSFATTLGFSSFLAVRISRKHDSETSASLLYILPLFTLLGNFLLLLIPLYILPLIFGVSFWNQITGLDTTRVQFLLRVLFYLFALNTFLSLPVAINLFFRERLNPILPPAKIESSKIPITPRHILLTFTLILIALLTYIYFLSPDHGYYFQLKAKWHVNQDPDQTITDLETYLQRYPKGNYRENARYRLGRMQWYFKGNSNSAIKNLEITITNFPNSHRTAECIRLMMYIHKAQKNWGKIISLGNAFINNHVGSIYNPELQLLVAEAENKMGRTKEAKQRIALVQKQCPNQMILTFDSLENLLYMNSAKIAAERLLVNWQKKTK